MECVDLSSALLVEDVGLWEGKEGRDVLWYGTVGVYGVTKLYAYNSGVRAASRTSKIVYGPFFGVV